MSDQEDVELDEQIANTVIKIGKWSFTPAKLMILVGVVTSTLGGLYGAFEVYKDYQDMKEKIETYVAPDLSELNKKMELTMQNAEKSVQYTQDIKNDLKSDIRRIEGIVDSVERQAKQSARDTDQDLKIMNKAVEGKLQKLADDQEKLKGEVDKKIQRALDNPLNN
jgi:lysyl-tRNA synthetase class II